MSRASPRAIEHAPPVPVCSASESDEAIPKISRWGDPRLDEDRSALTVVSFLLALSHPVFSQLFGVLGTGPPVGRTIR